MIKAVLFDMDGIMFDTEKIMSEGWQEAAKQLGFILTDQQMNQMRGSSKARNTALFKEWYGDRVNYEEGRRIRSKYQEDYIAANSLPEKPGLHELLQWLKEQEIPAAVATSTSRKNAERYWDMAGISSLLTASVCGDEVTHSKPDPEIFLKAAAKLHVPIEHCLVLEDSINGLKAAKAVGAVSCMVPDLTPYTQELAPVCDYVCKSLLECIPLIEKENSVF